MGNSTGGGIHPFRLHGSRGALLAVYHPAIGGATPLGDILLVPPFAEEMNRCRAMASIQARAFSALGVGTLILDPYGTGDSGGDFSDATWESWREDLQLGIAWLRRNGNGCRTLWGIRLGAIMAGELAVRDGGIGRLLLWQPVAQGKGHFTQFLRIRIAAEMERDDGIKSTEELRKLSAANEAIEVSGYRIGPALARSLDQVRLPDASTIASAQVAWLEVLSSADTPVPPVTSKMIEGYSEKGVDVSFRTVTGPAFWQLHERAVAPNLIDETTAVVSAWAASAVAVGPDAGPRSHDAPLPVSGSERDPEYPLVLQCEGDELAAILHRGTDSVRRGIVIVVAGGPQYRAGAHRQFVSLARNLAARGHAVLRFDLRGMGDSSGVYRGYQHSESDIRAAVDALVTEQPHVDSVVLVGECESASGILFYAYKDSRVKGIALVNPWVRTDEGHAQAMIKHYYFERLWSRDFWRKVGAGKFDLRESLVSFVGLVRTYLRGRRTAARVAPASPQDDISHLPLPAKTAAGLRRFGGAVMILMSGRDWIAKEFDDVTRSSKAWEGLLDAARIRRHVLVDADHTFSRAVWKRQVSDWMSDWLASW